VDGDALVSVIIPVFNRPFCIVEAVCSALDQTYPALECIVIDDGSTDDTLAVVSRAFRDDPRLRVLATRHAGVSAARNHGLRHASGRFVTFLDSDDLMLRHRIERQLAILAAGTADAVVGRLENVPVDGVPQAHRSAWIRAMPDGYCHISVLLERQLALDVGGFDEDLELGEDLDFLFKLEEAGIRIARLDETILERRCFGDNAVNRADADHHVALLRAVRRHLARRRLRAESIRGAVG
jgi:glycosyltransferase involved in cell wall biosynthesis